MKHWPHLPSFTIIYHHLPSFTNIYQHLPTFKMITPPLFYLFGGFTIPGIPAASLGFALSLGSCCAGAGRGEAQGGFLTGRSVPEDVGEAMGKPWQSRPVFYSLFFTRKRWNFDAIFLGIFLGEPEATVRTFPWKVGLHPANMVKFHWGCWTGHRKDFSSAETQISHWVSPKFRTCFSLDLM